MVRAELERLDGHTPDLDPQAGRGRADRRRIVDKLLHAPTVRVKQLAEEPGGPSYAEALNKLFGLDPEAVWPLTAGRRLPRSAHETARRAVMTGPLRLGTRRSALAWPSPGGSRPTSRRTGRAVELVQITTYGDTSREALGADRRHRRVRLRAARRLLAGEVDLAVHSLKDLPTADAEGMRLAAVPPREDPRDVLVARDGLGLAELPAGSWVGTGSPRRMAQLRALGFGLEVVAVRGNVDTRLRVVADGKVDAVVLARAGLPPRPPRRGHRGDRPSDLPAPGQGALAIECRSPHDQARRSPTCSRSWTRRDPGTS